MNENLSLVRFCVTMLERDNAIRRSYVFLALGVAFRNENEKIFREPSRRRVSYGQLELLWEFLNRRRDIALGYNKTIQAREFAHRMWEEIALSLNSQGDGAQKDWKGWCKYWNDYKCKIKKAAVAKRRSMQQTGGGPPIGKPLTEIEKKFLQILGEDFGLGLPGIMVQPFIDETQADIQEVHGPIVAGGSESILTEMHLVPVSPPAPVDISQPGTSWQQPHVPPLPTSPTLVPPPTSPPPLASLVSTPARSSPAAALPSTPRRRRRRREPLLTAEVARRALLREAQRRADFEEREAQRRVVVDERNSAMLRELVNDIKETKEILRRWTET